MSFKGLCPNGEFRCFGGKCIDYSLVCDDNPDCVMEDDEEIEACGRLLIKYHMSKLKRLADTKMSAKE